MLAFPDNNYKDKWRWMKSTPKLGAYELTAGLLYLVFSFWHFHS